MFIQQLLVGAAKHPALDHHLTHERNERVNEDDYTRFKRRWLYKLTNFICWCDTTADNNEGYNTMNEASTAQLLPSSSASA